MGDFDPPEEEEFLGCPVCGAEESDLIESSENDYTCKVCGCSQNWAWDNLGKYVPIWNIQQEDESEWQSLSEKDLAELESIRVECENQRFLAAGWIDEKGELTDRYYRESDFQFDVARERR